ncbi:MAG: DUF2189 domain-containing protein [Pseudomonadota bacterium]
MSTSEPSDQIPPTASPAGEAPTLPLRPPEIAPGRCLHWLRAGWQDLRGATGPALRYGIGFVALSWTLVLLLFLSGLEWMLLPALAGAMLMGPLVATGLYQISRAQNGVDEALPAAPDQIGLLGAILLVLLLAWIRAATLIYALFFGLTPFPGFLDKMLLIFATPDGLAMLAIGTAVGGLFAALTFALTAFSIPMLVSRDIDAFTAMGRSFSAVTHNLRPAIEWAAAILVLSVIGFATGLLGMIVVFPWLGFATWHAYSDVFGDRD